MKKAILAIVTASLLAGCVGYNAAPSYTSANPRSLSDDLLCTAGGYAQEDGDPQRVTAITSQLKNRIAFHTITVSPVECQTFARMGVQDAQRVRARRIESMNAVTQQLNQQQALRDQQYQSAPIQTTHCNSLTPGSLVCNTF